ncbi:hypothetical protein PPYR_13419 [Photinus pyralis]|uniref:Bee-milk protein n=1 Tax=Photinus pyralis TaxID=7054 RepID=A0A1Y1LM04_PHOPY|nr:major royal jelly protein 1-like [Photinus pyralis]KAB0793799.1 hypothetical protein PPYR_13419 [Photinus pyralis]
MWKLALLVLAQLSSAINAEVQFRVIKQWKFVNYTWGSNEAYRSALESGIYVPQNVVMAGITYYKDYFYITMPRMKSGVPATLGRISALPGFGTSPLIEPFPSWDFNKLDDCDALQNVQNLEIDPSGTMYILDGGHTHSLMQTPVKNCPAQLVIYDLRKNTTVSKHVFPESVASRNDSFLYDLVVDNDFVYITDNSANDPGIVVYSLSAGRSWKIRHSASMRADPKAQNFKVNNDVVNAPINIAGIALGPRTYHSASGVTLNHDREVFYCPMSSLHLYSISTAILQNEANSNNGQDYPGLVHDVGRKASQTDGMMMTNKGVLYYGLLGDNSIAQWNSTKPFSSGQKVLSRDPNYIQWTNAFTIDTNGSITVLSNTLQSFIHGDLDTHKYNFWLLSAEIGEQSYLYEDSSTMYSPLPNEETSEPSSSSSPTPTTSTSTTPSSTTTATPKLEQGGGGGGASQQILELSVIIMAVSTWFFYNN